MKLRLFGIWGCVLYFLALFIAHLGQAVWGTLGVMRPGNIKDGMIEATSAAALVHSYAAPLQRLTWLVGFGVVLLLCVAISLSRKQETAEPGGGEGRG